MRGYIVRMKLTLGRAIFTVMVAAKVFGGIIGSHDFHHTTEPRKIGWDGCGHIKQDVIKAAWFASITDLYGWGWFGAFTL